MVLILYANSKSVITILTEKLTFFRETIVFTKEVTKELISRKNRARSSFYSFIRWFHVIFSLAN